MGARPSQEAKCLTGGHLAMSVPISDKIVKAREVLKPSTATKLTPVRRIISASTLKLGLFLPFLRRLRLDTAGTECVLSQRGFMAAISSKRP